MGNDVIPKKGRITADWATSGSQQIIPEGSRHHARSCWPTDRVSSGTGHMLRFSKTVLIGH